MIDRLHRTADMIDARRRILVCRIAEKIENDRLLVVHAASGSGGWSRRSWRRPKVHPEGRFARGRLGGVFLLH